MRVQDFAVNIIGLSQKEHHFEYEFGDGFFGHYGTSLLSSGHFTADVALDKGDTMIKGIFHIQGTALLMCDRSLEPFDHLMDINQTILFKYGLEDKELTNEIVQITRDRSKLDIGQYLYELICVNVPMKRLHPKFQHDDMEESEIQLVYSSPTPETENTEDDIDPRWEKLKKLKS